MTFENEMSLLLFPVEMILYGMTIGNSGYHLRALNRKLLEFMKKRRTLLRSGSYHAETDIRVMFLIETIVHYSTMIYNDPECIVDVSLKDIQKCAQFVGHISENSSNGNGMVVRDCLMLLHDIKKRDHHVSILLSRFRSASRSANSIVINIYI